jgi:hypothetical protein
MDTTPGTIITEAVSVCQLGDRIEETTQGT